jgi:hypothetical protein
VSPSSDRFVRKLSVAASVSLTLMLAATLVYIAWPRVAGALGMTSAPAPAPPVYTAGETIDAPAAWYSTAPYTLILFARKSCVACEKAQPFIKTLAASLQGRAAVVMAHPDGADSSEADDRDYAKSVGIAEAATFVTPAGLKVRATPTLVLVDRQGRVLHAWEGVGNAEKQAQITTAIGAALR